MSKKLVKIGYDLPEPMPAPVAPKLLLSSESYGWDGLLVQTFEEPAELQGYLVPGILHTKLVLITCGAIQAEQRPINGKWRGLTVRQGDLTLTPPGGPEVAELRWRSISAEPVETLHLQLDYTLVARIAAEEMNLNPATLNIVHRARFQDHLITQVGLTLRQELENPSPVSKLYAETAARLVIFHLLNHYTGHGHGLSHLLPESSQKLTRRQLNRVVDFSRYHLSEDLSLDALASQAGFSAFHFAHLFRRTTGESPHQFVLRQRIEKACQLLKDTDTPLAHIAMEVGFANQSHFSRVFKRYCGLTPRNFRQNT